MWLNHVSNQGPLALESDALPTSLRGPAIWSVKDLYGALIGVGKL